MSISQEELLTILKKNYPSGSINVKDFVGDRNHYFVNIKDSVFRGMSLVEQHQHVQKSLKEVLNTKLHAVQIKTEIV